VENVQNVDIVSGRADAATNEHGYELTWLRTDMASNYHAVAGLQKGLRILRILNRLGEASTARVAAEAGLPRPTAHRLLETLRGEGYLQRASLREPYRLTLLVHTLAEGYHDVDWIEEIAAPVLAELRAEVVWPTDVATYDGGRMVIRLTTHSSSPLSIERVSRGREIAMLTSATGRAYLAFCPARERAAILEQLRSTPGVRWPARLELELAATRKRGYGLRIRGSVQPKTSSIAVPVRFGLRVIACINLHWIHAALKPETAVARYLRPLQQAVARIEKEFAKQAAASEA